MFCSASNQDAVLTVLQYLDVSSLLVCRRLSRFVKQLIDTHRNCLPKGDIDELQLFGGHGTWRTGGQNGEPTLLRPSFVHFLKNTRCAKLCVTGDATSSNACYFDAAVLANRRHLRELEFRRSALNAVKYLSKHCFTNLRVLHLKDIPIVHGRLVTHELFYGLCLEELMLLPRWNSEIIWETVYFSNFTDVALEHLSASIGSNQHKLTLKNLTLWSCKVTVNGVLRLLLEWMSKGANDLELHVKMSWSSAEKQVGRTFKNLTLWSCKVTVNGVLRLLLEWMSKGANDIELHVKMSWNSVEKQVFVETLRLFCSGGFEANDFSYSAVCGRDRRKLELSL